MIRHDHVVMQKEEHYYVMFYNHKSKIYLSWIECRRQVNGFKGVKHKSFKVSAKAKEFESKA